MSDAVTIDSLSAEAEEADGSELLVVSTQGFEGPLHMLLDMARRQKVDLRQVSILDLANQYSLAIGYGILTCENREQAWARASRDCGDKGAAAANACLDMLRMKSGFGLYPR